MDIREIEKIIDNKHKTHTVFQCGKCQTFFDLLSSFEDLVSICLMSALLNPMSLGMINPLIDSINMSLMWANELCCEGNLENKNISDKRYISCCDLLNNYAIPYSEICSGYISYSRERFSASIIDKCITFDINDKWNYSVWNDLLRETASNNSKSFEFLNDLEIVMHKQDFKEMSHIEDGELCYNISSSIYESVKRICEKQWNITKTLPDDWEFDLFSLEDYKKFWIEISILCYIHFFCCSFINDPSIRLNNRVIIQPKKNIISAISRCSQLNTKTVETMINYISFEPNKKNADIMYQPIIELNDSTVMISPILFICSRPERNLLCVVNTKNDKNHSREVNSLEDLMIAELEQHINCKNIVKRKKLNDSLPDIDFAIFDENTSSVLLCELKWFLEADSTKEVYAREDEITHGCEQVESVMNYAMSDKQAFIKQVFGVESDMDYDLFCCVIAKHNVRTKNKYVPVIDIQSIEKLFESLPLNTVFHAIRNRDFEIDIPDSATITHKEVNYAGYTFKIPAICYE